MGLKQHLGTRQGRKRKEGRKVPRILFALQGKAPVRVQALAQQSLPSAERDLSEVHVAHTLRFPRQRPLPASLGDRRSVIM